jgi:hypothetical protein
MNGEDISGVGTLTATDATISGTVDAGAVSTESISSNRVGTRTSFAEFTDDGAYTWFNGRPQHYNGKTYLGYINDAGETVAASYNHSTDTVTTNILTTAFIADDHNAAGVVVQDDGTLTYCYTGHNTSNIYIKNSTNPEDISSFNAEITISPTTSHSYARPFQLDNGTIYLFYRGASDLGYVTSTDGGATWSNHTTLVTSSGTSIYVQLDQSGNRIDILATNAINQGDGDKEDVRHGYLDGGTVYDSGGTALGSSSVPFTDLTLVYDSSAGSSFTSSWVWDIARRGTGDIEAVWATFPDYDEHVYRYGHYDGSSWSQYRITNGGRYISTGAAGERYYSGGVALDRATKGLCYVSVADNDSGVIQRWTTPDNGQTWRSAKLGGGGAQNVRPFAVRDPHADVPVVWMHGDYQYWENGGYQTGIRGGVEGNNAATNADEPGFVSAYLNTQLEDIPGGTFTQVPIDTVKRDTIGSFDASTGTFNAPAYGIYLIAAGVTFKAESADSDGVGEAGEYFSTLYKNGSEVAQFTRRPANAGDFPCSVGSTMILLGKGDTISLYAYQDSGAKQGFLGGEKATRIEITRLQ